MIIFHTQADPLTMDHIDALKALHDQYHQKIMIIPTLDLDPIIDRLNQKLIKPYRYLSYGRNHSENGLVIDEDSSLVESSIQVRHGHYHRYPLWVCDSLNQTMIYYDQMLTYWLNDHRYHHTYSMMQLAIDLAHHHGIDPIQTKRCALLHDIAKNMDDELLIALCKRYDPSCLNQPKPIWHQYGGAMFSKYYLRIHDDQLIHAIANHTTGHVVSPLARIIYIADKCDPSRDYDSSKLIHLAFRDLTIGFLTVQQESEAYVTTQHHH